MDRVGRKRRATAKSAIGAIDAADLNESIAMVMKYQEPYQAVLGRSELRSHLLAMITGLTSDLERKSVEPIAVMHGLPRYILQHFVGGSRWAWEPLQELVRREAGDEIGVPDGTLVFDGSATPKKGTATVGVARQWCGRLGKQDICVVGVYAAYVGRDAATLVGSELPPSRVGARPEAPSRSRCLRRLPTALSPGLPGRCFRSSLRKDPSSGCWATTSLGARARFGTTFALSRRTTSWTCPGTPRCGASRKGTTDTLERKHWDVERLRRTLPVADWAHFHVRDGEKGPVEVRATMLPVATERSSAP